MRRSIRLVTPLATTRLLSSRAITHTSINSRYYITTQNRNQTEYFSKDDMNKDPRTSTTSSTISKGDTSNTSTNFESSGMNRDSWNNSSSMNKDSSSSSSSSSNPGERIPGTNRDEAHAFIRDSYPDDSGITKHSEQSSNMSRNSDFSSGIASDSSSSSMSEGPRGYTHFNDSYKNTSYPSSDNTSSGSSPTGSQTDMGGKAPYHYNKDFGSDTSFARDASNKVPRDYASSASQIPRQNSGNSFTNQTNSTSVGMRNKEARRGYSTQAGGQKHSSECRDDFHTGVCDTNRPHENSIVKEYSKIFSRNHSTGYPNAGKEQQSRAAGRIPSQNSGNSFTNQTNSTSVGMRNKEARRGYSTKAQKHSNSMVKEFSKMTRDHSTGYPNAGKEQQSRAAGTQESVEERSTFESQSRKEHQPSSSSSSSSSGSNMNQNQNQNFSGNQQQNQQQNRQEEQSFSNEYESTGQHSEGPKFGRSSHAQAGMSGHASGGPNDFSTGSRFSDSQSSNPVGFIPSDYNYLNKSSGKNF